MSLGDRLKRINAGWDAFVGSPRGVIVIFAVMLVAMFGGAAIGAALVGRYLTAAVMAVCVVLVFDMARKGAREARRQEAGERRPEPEGHETDAA